MEIERLYASAYNPATICILAKTGFNRGDNDYFLATSANDYLAKIQALAVDQQNDFSYVGADRVIRYNGNAEDIVASGCDYVAWQNSNFGNKWWFGFIDSVRFVNPNRADISVTVDVIGTFIYDINIGSQYCRRITVDSDTYGEWIANEGLPCDDYVYSYWQKPAITGGAGSLSDFFIAVAGYSLERVGATYDGLPYTGRIVICQNANEVAAELKNYIDNDDWFLYNVYTIPKCCVPGVGLLYDIPLTYISFTIQRDVVSIPFKEVYANDEAGWLPNNGKLYIYPYTALYITNNIGKSEYLKFEDFNLPTPEFTVCINHTYPVTPTLYPVNYAGSNGNHRNININYAMDLGAMPQLGFMGDSYASWIGGNSQSMQMELVGHIIGAGLSIAMAKINPEATAQSIGAAYGQGTMGVVGTIASQEARKNAASQQPPKQIGSSVQTNASMIMGDNAYGPTFARAQIPQYLAKQYDDYFSLYGYKVDRTFTIDLFNNRRPLFNYYETVSAHIKANIPMEYARQIETIFNSGVRFWYDINKVGDYSDENLKSNSIL